MTTYPTAAIREALLRAGCSLAMTDAAMVHLELLAAKPEARYCEGGRCRCNATTDDDTVRCETCWAAGCMATKDGWECKAAGPTFGRPSAAKPEAKTCDNDACHCVVGYGAPQCSACSSAGCLIGEGWRCKVPTLAPAPAASPPACRPWCGEGVNRPPRPETHYVRDGRRWCHDGRINHDHDRDHAKAVPREHTADCGMDLDHKAPCAPSNATGHAVPPVGQPGVPAGFVLRKGWRLYAGQACDWCDQPANIERTDADDFACWPCARDPLKAGAIVPVEPSRPGTGEAVDFDPAIHCSAEEFQVRIGRAKQRLGVPPVPPAPGKPACYCTAATACAFHQPGKPDEAPLSDHAKTKHDFYPCEKPGCKGATCVDKLPSQRATEHGWPHLFCAQEMRALEANLATRTAEVESLREKFRVAEWHSEQDQRDYKRVCEDMKVARAENESLRAAATAQVARIAELEDEWRHRNAAVQAERERVNTWWMNKRGPCIDWKLARDLAEGIASGAPAPKATP